MPFDDTLTTGTRPDRIPGRIDPKGRISVTTFRGLPKPGDMTPEVRLAIERARADAQAPLDDEVIPRRYREGIREYFDGLGSESDASETKGRRPPPAKENE